jgi:steroid Delta-isomerase
VKNSEMIEVVNTYVTAYNKADMASILSLFAAGATMEDPVGAPPASGEEEIRALYQIGFDMGITLELDGRVRAAAGHVAFPVCATSENGKLYIIDVFEFDDAGKIVRMRAFWSMDNLEGEMDIEDRVSG